jgi:hypothetical protein
MAGSTTRGSPGRCGCFLCQAASSGITLRDFDHVNFVNGKNFIRKSVIEWGFRTMPISVPGHADHPFRDDGDHDSGMMPITRSGMIPIS